MTESEIKYYEIGETYFRINLDYNKNNQELIKSILLKEFKGKAKEFLKFSEDIKFSIEFDKGSLKAKIKIWGTILTIYIGIGQYGSFRQGVREIVDDVKSVSEYFMESFSNEPNIGEDNIIRFERRTGLVGRIDDIFIRIDRLERKQNALSHQEIQTELNSIKQEISNISFLLTEHEQQQFFDDLPENYSDNLPNPDNRRVNYLISRYALKPDDENEFIEITTANNVYKSLGK